MELDTFVRALQDTTGLSCMFVVEKKLARWVFPSNCGGKSPNIRQTPCFRHNIVLGATHNLGQDA